MTYRLLIGFVWLTAIASLQAGTVKLKTLTVGSTTYSNVTVFGANSTDLFFSSDSGVSNVKLKHLDPKLQKEFNYSSNDAEKAEQTQIQDDKIYQDHLAAMITARVTAERAAREAQVQASYSAAGFSDPVGNSSPIGKPLAELDSVKWIDVKPDLTGNFAIISVWSPKSASCKKWIPSLNALYKAVAGKVEMVGVTTATADEVAQADPKLDFPCGTVSDGKFLAAAGINSLPSLILVDTNSVVRYVGHPAAVTTNTLQTLFKSTTE